MSQELSKQDLRKPDEFVGFFESKIHQFENRKKQIFWALIIVLIGLGVGFFIQSTRTSENQVAANSFAKVMEKLPSNLSKTTGDWGAFLTEMDAFLAQYPKTSFTPSAFLYKGKAQFTLKQYPEALASYQTAASKLKAPYNYLAREGEAMTQMQLEKWAEAKTIWTDISAKEDNPLRDYHLFNLALVQDQLDDHVGAAATREKIAKDFPTSQYADKTKLKTPLDFK